MMSLLRKKYSPSERKYILSKIKGMKFSAIPETLKTFWIDYKLKNEKSC